MREKLTIEGTLTFSNVWDLYNALLSIGSPAHRSIAATATSSQGNIQVSAWYISPRRFLIENPEEKYFFDEGHNVNVEYGICRMTTGGESRNLRGVENLLRSISSISVDSLAVWRNPIRTPLHPSSLFGRSFHLNVHQGEDGIHRGYVSGPKNDIQEIKTYLSAMKEGKIATMPPPLLSLFPAYS